MTVETMTKQPGVVLLLSQLGAEVRVECHNEDEIAWEGYDTERPNQGYRLWPKATFSLTEDQRGEL